MDKEEILSRIDLGNIQEKLWEILPANIEKGLEAVTKKMDYLVDWEGNFMIPLSPLEYRLIEEINDLKERIKKLEEK